jgi:hypothetical protein
MENIHNDYPQLDEDDKEFAKRLLFIDLIENVIKNRKTKKGPQLLGTIIDNDLQELKRIQNYEAACLYRDTRDHFKEDIILFDKGY